LRRRDDLTSIFFGDEALIAPELARFPDWPRSAGSSIAPT
jgi:hypothetical protein